MSGIAITFPGSPAEGQSYLAQNGFTYIYDSQKNRWKRGGDFVRAPKVLSYAGIAVTTTGSGITTGPNGALIYEIPGVVSPSSTAGIDSYKAYRYTDSYPNYTEIQVSISSAFSSVAYAATSTSTTFIIPGSTLSGNTTYYLRARQFVGSNASIASTGEISGYSPNVVRFITTSVYLDSPTIVSIAGTTGFPVYQIGFAGTTLPATVTYSGSGVGNLEKVEWRVTGPRNPDSTGDTALAEVGIGTLSSATLANSLVLAMPFSGAAGVGITNDVNNAIRTASGASAGTTKTVTANGGIGTTSVSGISTLSHFYDSAAYFDNTDDYLSTNLSSSFAANDFTIECWIYPFAFADDSVVGERNNSYFGFNLYNNNFRAYFNTGYTTSTITSKSFSPYAWYHVAMVRKGSIGSLYINGSLEGSTVISGTMPSQTISVGSYYNAYYYSGYMQDLKIYTLAKYTENFTPPLPTYGTISYTTGITNVGVTTTAFYQSTGDVGIAETSSTAANALVLAMPMNKTFGFQDINVAVRGLTSGASAGTAKTVGLGTTSTANAPSHPIISATKSKWYDGGAYFDGGDYLSISSNNDFGFGTGDITIEFWLYPTSLSGVQVWTDFRSGSTGPTVYTNGTSLQVALDSGNNIFTTTPTLITNNWQHISFVRSVTTAYLFVNGVLSSSASNSTNYGTADSLIIGLDSVSSGQYATGYLQDLKIYKGLAKYTANFTPPRPICGFTTDLAIQTGFTTTSATGALLSSVVGLGSTSTLAFGADQTYSGITSITSSSGITTLPDTYAQNLVLALPLANITGVGNSFTNDRNTQIRTASITGAGVTAGTTKTITNTGVTTVSMGSTSKWYGNTAYFDGGDYLDVTDDGSFDFGTDNFTIEFYINIPNINTTFDIIGTANNSVYLGGSKSGWIIAVLSTGSIRFGYQSSNSWIFEIEFGLSMSSSRWHHVSISRSGTSLICYVDGVQGNSSTNSTNIQSTENICRVGGGYGSSNLLLTGYLQDIKIYKGTAKYTTNFTPPPPMFGDYVRSTPNKIVFTPGSDYVLEARNTASGGIVTSTYSASRQWGTKPEGGIYDPYGANLVLAIPGGAVGGATSTFDVTGQIRFETPTATYVNAGIVTYSNSLGIGTYGNKSITNVGVAVSTNISKYYGRSMYFLGTGNLNSYLSVADSADFDFQGDWTIQCWVYFTRGIGTQEAIWASNTDFKRPSVFRLVGGTMGYFASSNGSSWDILNGDAGALNGIGSIIVSSNQWNHVVFQRRGTTYTGYINGVVDLNKTIAGTLFNAAEAFTIGRWGVSYSMQGHIQDFIIYNNLAKYTSNFTPPNQIYLT